MTAALEFKPEVASDLASKVKELSGQNLFACYQCRRCAAGCTVGDETGFCTPDYLIRLILMGDREKAINNALVWQCTSCYTCGERCPNDIQTGRITETMKKMAEKEKMEPLSPRVSHFHHSFTDSGLRWGRVNEMEFMSFYELKTILKDARKKNFKAIMDEVKTQTLFALEMFKLKRMHFGMQSAKGRKEIKRLFKKNKGTPIDTKR
jgi:heterodisulfide reductase subunit C